MLELDILAMFGGEGRCRWQGPVSVCTVPLNT